MHCWSANDVSCNRTKVHGSFTFIDNYNSSKRNHNVDFSKSSFGQWVSQYVELLTPVYDALVKTTLSSNYIQNDESPYKVQTEEKKGNTHLGYMWATRNPQNNLIIFLIKKEEAVSIYIII
ncbi:MAG: transposase [Bacteroidetes bacterium]|nr:transposase [Bacteroidota bacterium]